MKSVFKKVVSITLLVCFLLMQVSPITHAQNTPQLSKEQVKSMFISMYQNNPPTIRQGMTGMTWNSGWFSVHKFEIGNFTGESNSEALISVYDGNKSHSAGWGEIWLLRYEGGWKVVSKIVDSMDSADFKTADINGDGVLEVLTIQHSFAQGYGNYVYKLVSLAVSPRPILYQTKGFDNTGTKHAVGDVVDLHDITFQDVDNDGILELIDVETKKGREKSGSGFRETYSVSNKTVHKINLPKLSKSVNISLDVNTGKITLNNKTYELPFELYDEQRDGWLANSVKEALIKNTILWYQAKYDFERNMISKNLIEIRNLSYEQWFKFALEKIFSDKIHENIGGLVSILTDKWLGYTSIEQLSYELPKYKAMYCIGRIEYLAENALRTGNLVHYDQVNGGTGEWLPSELKSMYPETEFRITRRGQAGADVEYLRGKHPSEYEYNPLKWKPGNNYGDFKPNTLSGWKTFLKDINKGKLPVNSEYLPYDPETGELVKYQLKDIIKNGKLSESEIKIKTPKIPKL